METFHHLLYPLLHIKQLSACICWSAKLNEWFNKWKMNEDLGQTDLNSKSCIWFWPLKTSRMALCFPQMLWLDCNQVRKKTSSVLLKEIKGLGSQSGNFCWSAQRALVVIDLSEPQVSEESTKNTKHPQRNKEFKICFCPAQKIENQNLISLIFFPGFWETPLPWRHQASLRIRSRNFDKNPLTCVGYSPLELSASVWNTLSLGHAMSKGMVWWELL